MTNPTKSTNSSGGAAKAAELARKGREGDPDNASGGDALGENDFSIPSISDPEATDLATSGSPDPKEANEDSPNSIH
jgi:hypothetical protein